MENKKGPEVVSVGAYRVRKLFPVLRPARDGVFLNLSARTQRGTHCYARTFITVLTGDYSPI